MISDKLLNAHHLVRDEFHFYISRNAYLPVVGEGEVEGFKLQIKRCAIALQHDVEEAQLRGGSYVSSHFGAAYKSCKDFVLGSEDTHRNGQIKGLWRNAILIKVITFVSLLGPHFASCKLFESYSMGNNVNGIFGAVRTVIFSAGYCY
jgi:hypothetical protein